MDRLKKWEGVLLRVDTPARPSERDPVHGNIFLAKAKQIRGFALNPDCCWN